MEAQNEFDSLLATHCTSGEIVLYRGIHGMVALFGAEASILRLKERLPASSFGLVEAYIRGMYITG